MLGSFKMKMLVVIIIAALAGLSIQSDHSSKKLVEPVIKYILKDYGVEDRIALYVCRIKENRNAETVSVSSPTTLQLPCEFREIEREYGWYWNEEANQQEFFPAVLVEVQQNSVVRPIYEGIVADISSDERGRTVLIDHGGGLFSSYGGLREIMVDKGVEVTRDTAIAKNGEQLYFQISSNDGPLNPKKLFEQ